jgi:hypothetical protein
MGGHSVDKDRENDFMNSRDIKKYLQRLNDLLSADGVKGEMCLYGGAVMCLAYNARPNTKDVDAVFEPSQKIRGAAKKVAEENRLPKDWLNDAVKGFLVKHPRTVLFNWSNLKVHVADPEYILAMKSMAARVDTRDKQDIKFLIRKLGIKSAQEVFDMLEKYYPKKQIKPATQFFIEELFGK